MSLSDRQDSAIATPSRTINPLIPLSCLALVLLLLAATIVLSLIPLYLRVKNVDNRIGLGAIGELDFILRNGYLPYGSLSAENCAAFQDYIREQAAAGNNVGPSAPIVESCTAIQNSSTTSSSRRKKRQIGSVSNTVRLLIFVPAGNCITNNCILSRGNALFDLLLGAGDIRMNLALFDGSRFDFIGFYSTEAQPSVVLPPSETTLPTVTSSLATTTTSSLATTTTSSLTTTTTTFPSAAAINLLFNGINSQNQLLFYNSTNPSIVIRTLNITGVISGDIISNIDVRTGTGDLYGTSNTRLYIINTLSGVARTIGEPLNSSYGAIIGIETDPNRDRFIYQTTSGTYLVIDPNTNHVSGIYVPNGVNGISMGVSNNQAGSSTSKLYFINATTSALYVNDIAQNSNVTKVGSGFGINIDDTIGFDISSLGIALACLKINNSLLLYVVNLDNGTLGQRLGVISESLSSLSIPTAAVAYGVVSSNNSLLYINGFRPGFKFYTKNMSGLLQGENILAIDMRPYNGQVFAIGSTSRLYGIDLGPGTVFPISNMSFTPSLDGTAFDIDFNPVVDLIRLVSNTGQNLRISPITGQVVGVDTPINPSGLNITSIAYSNNVVNATSTILYDIGSTFRKLYIQNPPNNGTLVEVGNLLLPFDENNGFDISSFSQAARIILTTNGTSSIYVLNVTSGEATTALSTLLPAVVRSFTLGHNL